MRYWRAREVRGRSISRPTIASMGVPGLLALVLSSVDLDAFLDIQVDDREEGPGGGGG